MSPFQSGRRSAGQGAFPREQGAGAAGRGGRVLPPPPPQSGARAPPPRFRFPRRHLRHGHFRHRLQPAPRTAGQKREAAAPRAALGQRELRLSPGEGRFCCFPPEVLVLLGQAVRGRCERGARLRCPHLRWRGGGLFLLRRWRRRERRSGRVAELARLSEGSGMEPSPPKTSPFMGTPYPATETPVQPCCITKNPPNLPPSAHPHLLQPREPFATLLPP